MCREPILSDSRNATSSPASGDGLTLCGLRDGGTSLFGPDRAPASHLAMPGSVSANETIGTCGRNFDASLLSVTLQSSLGNRLRQRLAAYGSPEYELTWKHWDMESGPPICALRASARRISGSGCSGWPTPNTPNGGRSVSIDKISSTGMTTDGRKHTVSLEHVAKFAGWPTPTQSLADKGVRSEDGAIKEAMRSHGTDSAAAVSLAGWTTPISRDHKDAASDLTNTPINNLLGRQVSLFPVLTETRGALNPEFVRWLMGFPAAWDDCAVTAMPSSRNSRRNSSKHTKTCDGECGAPLSQDIIAPQGSVTMTKEHIIEIRIPLDGENLRDHAKVLSAIDETIENLREDMRRKLGEEGFTFREETVTKRAKREYAPRPNARGPRKAKVVTNGAAAGDEVTA